MRIVDWFAVLVLVLAGVGSGLAATGSRRPEPLADELDLATSPFRLERKPADPLLVTPAKWLELPMLRGDFDLLADLELAAGTELDLIVRRVEPRPLGGVNLSAHGRFAVLRLSTLADGPAWRTPTAALLGPAGGLRLAAGSAATIALAARGRSLQANVAGKVLPEFLAADEQGSICLLVRGGTAAVHNLTITPTAAAPAIPPIACSAGLALLLAALAWRRRARPLPVLVGAALWCTATACARTLAFASLPPLAQPDPTAELWLALAGAPFAAVALLRRRIAVLAALATGLGGAVLALAIAAGRADVAQRFPPTPELDAWLGPDARETAIEVLGQRLRGPMSVHTIEPNDHRVLLLGGQLLWRRGTAPDQHVEPLLTGDLRGAVRTAEVVALPTEDGWTGQQWRLYERFFTAFAPKVLVLGVPRDECAPDLDGRTPRSSAAAVAATVGAARAHCDSVAGRTLVVVLDNELPAEVAAAARAAAGADVPVVEVLPTDAAIGIARKLAAAIAPRLQ